MTDDLFSWTRTGALGVASSTSVMRTAQSLAAPWKWYALGCQPNLLWGLFPITNKPPIQTEIRTADMQSICTCAGRTTPCAHAVALLLLAAEQPDAFAQEPLPSWARKELDPALVDLMVRPAAGSAGAAFGKRRLSTTLAGLDLLESWLFDLVGSGFASTTHRPDSYWQTMASRLLDAHAPGPAAVVSQMTKLSSGSADWPDRMLAAAARLTLLIAAVRTYARAGEARRGDLHQALGWPPLWNHADRVEDRWWVLAAPSLMVDQVTWRRYWLLGTTTGRLAQIDGVPGSPHLPGDALLPERTVAATVEFAWGSTPQRGRLLAYGGPQPVAAARPVGCSIAAGHRAYAAALAANPWLTDFPLLLTGLGVQRVDDNWFVVDPEATLPLPPRHEHGWHLRAACDDERAVLFGLWSGETLTPQSVWSDGSWLELRSLKGVK